MQEVRKAMGRAGGGGRTSQPDTRFGGSYIVFVQRGGQPVAVNIKTGLTDLDYAEVVSGLSEQDSVLVLPSASLVSSQKEFTDRMNRMTGGGGIPGMRQQGTQSGQTGGTAPAGGARP